MGLVEVILPHVAKSAVLLLVAGGVCRLMAARFLRHAPRLCRLACLLALLPGWVFLSLPVTIPILEGDAGGSVTSLLRELSAATGLNGRILFGLWLTGMAGVVAAGMVGYGRLLWQLRAARPAPLSWTREWRRVAGCATARLPMLVAPGMGPMVCWRPGRSVLVVPAGQWAGLESVERRAVLLHELAHYRAGDGWTSLVISLLALPQWFNPAAWWVMKAFREASEWLCDDAAAVDESDRIRLARAIERLARSPGWLPVGAHAWAEHPVVTRVRRLVAPAAAGQPRFAGVWVAVLFSVSLAAAVVDVNLSVRGPAPAAAPSSSANGSVNGIGPARVNVKDEHGGLWFFAMNTFGAARADAASRS